MHATLWLILVITLLVWLASFVLDFGGTSVRALLAIVIIVLCYFVIARRTV
jgi:hypothetical protein